jgi:hypothetical protein
MAEEKGCALLFIESIRLCVARLQSMLDPAAKTPVEASSKPTERMTF